MSTIEEKVGTLPAEFQTVFELLAELLEAEAAEPCLPFGSPGELAGSVEPALPDEGRSAAELREALRRIVLSTPRTATPAFVNQLFGGRLAPATAAEMLTAVLNNSMYTFKVAGIQILVERAVLGEMLRQVGFGDGEGIFCPGGSVSNLVAMLAARQHALPETREQGLAGAPPLAVYASDQAHYSIRKNAGILGLGRENVHLIRTDDAGHILPEELERALEADRKRGLRPLMIVATAGTTVLGAFDPLPPLAELARRHDVWLHVDAALGGTLLFHPEHRRKLVGVEAASSVTWNLHKLVGVPLSASAILFPRRGVLQACLAEQADYLFQSDDDELNPGLRSIQCGRRNDALKVWTAFQVLGRTGLARRVDHQLRLARYAAERITGDPELDLVLPPESVNVCFRVRGADSARLAAELDRRGVAKISWGSFRGKTFLRLPCVNADLRESDIARLLEQIKAVARTLR
ncbi:MAG: aspartate aminotransferase family protein [Acidobacteriota bacterium]